MTVSDHSRLTWQLASLLLQYPDEELVDQLPVAGAAAARLPAATGTPLRRFVAHVQSTPTGQLAGHYAETFDFTRRCCLYLTYYAYGDTRKRGMALLRFKSAFRSAGLVLRPDELPDHLAVVLEFAATGDPAAGYRLLVQHRAGLELLRLALLDAGSPYADVVEAVSRTLPEIGQRDRNAVARLAAEGPPGEDVGLEPFAPPEYMPTREGARA